MSIAKQQERKLQAVRVAGFGSNAAPNIVYAVFSTGGRMVLLLWGTTTLPFSAAHRRVAGPGVLSRFISPAWRKSAPGICSLTWAAISGAMFSSASKLSNLFLALTRLNAPGSDAPDNATPIYYPANASAALCAFLPTLGCAGKLNPVRLWTNSAGGEGLCGQRRTQ